MALTAQCLYCFEVLSAHLKKQHPMPLHCVESRWTQYENGENPKEVGSSKDDGPEVLDQDNENEEDVRPLARTLRPRKISRLQEPLGSGSSSSTPSTLSATSLQAGSSSDVSKSSSRTSFSISPFRSPAKQLEARPLFVTWNTISGHGHKSLRGCIGTFEAQELSTGLESYALASALDDTRFAPIVPQELPSLSVSVTLLLDFTPCVDALDWDLGTHGIRISFAYHGRRYGATYLPDVAIEQGWTKEETVVSLMRKAGWSGRSSEWAKVADMHCVRYQGRKASVTYAKWAEWRAWVEKAV